LDKEARNLPPDWRLYIYYNRGSKLRYSGLSAMGNLNTGSVSILSEISYPPFGYVLTVTPGEPPDQRLAEITFFSAFRYADCTTLQVMLPTLETHLFYPGDYRSKQEILDCAAQSKSPPT
jgi:hypothetical protein